MSKLSAENNIITDDIAAPRSLYGQVISDDEARDTYLNTTQVVLTGNPNNPATEELCEALREAAVAYIFTPNRRLPRPALHSRQMIFVGKSNILGAIERLRSSH